MRPPLPVCGTDFKRLYMDTMVFKVEERALSWREYNYIGCLFSVDEDIWQNIFPLSAICSGRITELKLQPICAVENALHVLTDHIMNKESLNHHNFPNFDADEAQELLQTTCNGKSTRMNGGVENIISNLIRNGKTGTSVHATVGNGESTHSHPQALMPVSPNPSTSRNTIRITPAASFSFNGPPIRQPDPASFGLVDANRQKGRVETEFDSLSKIYSQFCFSSLQSTVL